MASSRALALAIAAGALLTACSGASSNGLFDGTSSTSSPADAGGQTRDAEGSSPEPDAGATPAHDAGAPSPHDSGTTPPPPNDAGPVDPGVACGQASCDPASAVCCRVDTGNSGGGAFSCVQPEACGQGAALSIPCDDARDCEAAGSPAGTICCVTADPQTGRATEVACVPPSSCADQTQTWLCDPSDAKGCPSGMTCSPSQQTIPGYDICHP